jgi:glycine/D-amino acid oxidase-like deaminating enzyme
VRSHWLREVGVDRDDPAPSLAGEHRADIAIVGGGFCGLWTALRVKELEPARDVAIVERDVCGGGASGRNAGYVLNLWAKFPTLLGLMASDEAVRVGRASAEAVAEIASFCERHGIDADLRRSGWLWGATCTAQEGAWDPVLEALEHHQLHPFETLTGAEIAARWPAAGYRGGVLEPSCLLIQPAKLVRGLRRVAIGQGIRIFERSPMVRLDRGDPAKVVTDRGILTADKVVIAMNAWSIALPELRRSLAVVAAEAAISPPIPELLVRHGIAEGPGFTDSRPMVANFRPTADGRLEFGKGGGGIGFGGRVSDYFEGHVHRLGAMRRDLAENAPRLADVPVEHTWCGPIDRSWAGIPLAGVFPHAPSVLYGVGFSGNGVGPTRLVAKSLAALALECEDEWSDLGLVRKLGPDFPAEPVRYVGGFLIRQAVERKDRAEHAGRPVGRLTGWLASKAPAGLTPTTTSS